MKQSEHTVVSPHLSVQISKNGEIIGIACQKDGIERPFSGQTRLAGFQQTGRVSAQQLDNGGVEFQRKLKSKKQARRCTLVERFIPTPDSIRWEMEISSKDAPWSTAISSGLRSLEPEGTKFWTSWGDPEQVARQMHLRRDPLLSKPLRDMVLWYGALPYETTNPLMCWDPYYDYKVFTIPLATLMDEQHDIGLSLALSLQDTLREISLLTTTQGDLVFSRYKHRLGGGRTVQFAMDLVAHEADWRGGLRWMSRRYPAFFDPPNPKADEVSGCGAYSDYPGEVDYERRKQMGLQVIWKTGLDNAYQGMILPPVPNDTDEWVNMLEMKSSRKQINDHDAMVQQQGLSVLEYYNIMEFGGNMKELDPLPEDGPWAAKHAEPVIPYTRNPAIPDEKLWESPADFLVARISDGILFQPGGRISIVNAYDSTPMDPGVPSYQAHLLEQAQRLLNTIPNCDGICIDRLDPFRLYNAHADDGESWHDGRPVRSLLWSWQDIFEKLGPMMHNAGKVIFVNNHIKRIEMLRHIDGLYDEFGAAHYIALQAIHKPAITWTVSEDSFKDNPDEYFQWMLYLGVFPSAPFPESHHNLTPSEFADHWYLTYGPLLNLMRGRKWVLEPHAVTVDNPTIKVNLFSVRGGYVLPVMFGGEATQVIVTVRNVAELQQLSHWTCRALHPGNTEWTPVPMDIDQEKLTLQISLQRGCAMVQLSVKS